MHVGLSTGSIESAVREPHQVHDPLLARSLVVCEAGRIVLLMTALDLLHLEGQGALALRRRLAETFQLAEHRVIIHVTHTHSAPPQHRLDMDALFKAMVVSVRRARARARPARMAFLQADADREFSRCRRWDSRAELGTVSVLHNDGCVFRNGEVYVKGYVQAELDRIGHVQATLPEEARLDGPVDRAISLLHFIDARGQSLGGLARFAAHADQVAGRLGTIFGAEYPGYLCRRLQRKLGGTFLFLNGPCADLKPFYEAYTWEACRRTGEGLADRLLARLPPRKAYRALTRLEVYGDQLYLQPRRDVAHDLGTLVTQVFELRAQAAALKNLPVKKAREADEYRWLIDTLSYIAGAFYGGDTRRMFAPRLFPLSLIAFNRTAHYLCMPDENFAEMTRRLHAGCPSLPHLQTVSLCNGAGWYLPPREEIAKGGYEPTFSISAPDAFDAVARTAVALARRAARGGREVWTAEGLARQLNRGGVRRGDLLLVHSAIRSCGYVEGRANGMLHALRLAVGTEGTLLFPTLTGSRTDHPDHPPSFDRQRTPGWTGALSQCALDGPGAIRSLHPTHSCVALGPQAHALTNDHVDSVTPVDARSPYQQVAHQGGKILIVGLDLTCLTLAHAVEEARARPDPCFARPCRCLIVDGDRRFVKDYRLHDWSVAPSDYEALRPALEKAGAIRALKVGDAASWLLDAGLALKTMERAWS